MNMHTAVVKLRGEDVPLTIGITNVAYGKVLASMPRAEWVQIITPSGYVVSGDGAGWTYAPIRGAADDDDVAERLWQDMLNDDPAAHGDSDDHPYECAPGCGHGEYCPHCAVKVLPGRAPRTDCWHCGLDVTKAGA